MAENSFFAPPAQTNQLSNLPPEVIGQYQDLARKQRLAEMLTAQGMQQPQGQMVSGRYVAPSFFQNIAPLVNTYLGNKASENVGQQQVKIAQALRAKNEQDVTSFQEALAGETQQKYFDPNGKEINAGEARTPEGSLKTGYTVDLIGGGKPDLAKALRIAAQSSNPFIQAQATDLVKTQKLGEGEKLYRPDMATGKLTVQASGGEKIPNDVKTAALTLGLPADPSQWNAQQMQAVNNQIIALKRASANNISISNNTEKSYGGELAQQFAKSDATLFQNAQKMPEILLSIDKQKALLNNPNTFVGVGADKLGQAAAIADAAGLGGKNTKEKAANTQTFYASRADSVLNAIQSSGLGAGQGFTNKDLQFLQDAKLGNITYTREALQRQLDIEERAARYLANQANTRLKQIPESSRSPLGLQPVEIPTFSNNQPSNIRSRADQIISGQ
jgi:hypothetical protein